MSETRRNPLRSYLHGPSTTRAGTPRFDQGRPRRRPVGRPLPLPVLGLGRGAAVGDACHSGRGRGGRVDADPRPAGHPQSLARAHRLADRIALLVVGPHLRHDAQQLRVRVRHDPRRPQGRRPQPRGGGHEPRAAAAAGPRRRHPAAHPAVDLLGGGGRLQARDRQLRHPRDPGSAAPGARGEGVQRVRERAGRQPADADDHGFAAGHAGCGDARSAEAVDRAAPIPDGVGEGPRAGIVGAPPTERTRGTENPWP